MTPVIMLCGLDNQAEDLHATAGRAVAWAVAALPDMKEGESGTWTQHREDGMGYVQHSVDEDGTETIRIRPDSGTTADDVVLVEDPRRTSGPHQTDLASSLARWTETFDGTRLPSVDHSTVQRRQAEVMAAVVEATARGGGRFFAIEPPSLHSHARILTLGSSGPDTIPDEEMLCAEADRLLGDVAWLSVRRSSGCRIWEFITPASHAFSLPLGGPDPVLALRAHAAMREGLPF